MTSLLSVGVRQSVYFLVNGLWVGLSAPVQKSTRSCATQLAPAHKVNVRRRSATGKLIDA